MTIDEAIKHAEEVAILNENTCKAKPDSNLKKYKKCAEEHRQLAEWLKDYKRLLEQEPCEDAVCRQAVFETIDDCDSDGLKGIFCLYADGERFKEYIKELPSVISKGVTVTDFADKCRECGKQKKGKWEYDPYKDRTKGHCNRCGHFMRYGEKTKFCPDCGTEMEGM